MNEFFTDYIWWITVIEIPVISTLFWIIWNTRKDFQNLMKEMNDTVQAHKLEVAKNYASSVDVKELEIRIVNYLLRIEAKLDRTALTTEALKAVENSHHDY